VDAPDRYLHFDNLDIEHLPVTSRCSVCEKVFSAEVKPGERLDDVLLRIRAEFDAHECGAAA
jgi:hypothetical protein